MALKFPGSVGIWLPVTVRRTLAAMSLITTPFGFRSTAAEVVAGIDLTGRRAIVTGASSGIGVETARALADAGAQVTLAVRNTDAGARTAAEIAATTGRADVAVTALEVTDPASVAAFASTWEGPLDILVNNAGVMMTPEQRTPHGWELQFATNHLVAGGDEPRARHGARARAKCPPPERPPARPRCETRRDGNRSARPGVCLTDA